MAQLMASHAAAVAGGSQGMGEENVYSHKWLASRDASAKVYSVHPHPWQPSVLVAATSVGIIVISLVMPHCSLVGAHESWDGSVLSFSDKVIRRSKYQLDRNRDAKSSAHDSFVPGLAITSPRRSLPMLPSSSRKSIARSVAKLQSSIEDPLTNVAGDAFPAFRTSSTEEISVSVDCSSVTNSLTTTKRNGKWDGVTLATATCRPNFFPSPTGALDKYSIFLWGC